MLSEVAVLDFSCSALQSTELQDKCLLPWLQRTSKGVKKGKVLIYNLEPNNA